MERRRPRSSLYQMLLLLLLCFAFVCAVLAIFFQENVSNGHGRYSELPDQPAFFEATKKSKVM